MFWRSKTENRAGPLLQMAQSQNIVDLFWLNEAIHNFLLSNKFRHVTFLLPQQSWNGFNLRYKTLHSFPQKFIYRKKFYWHITNLIYEDFLQLSATLASRSIFVWLQNSESARIRCNSEPLKKNSEKTVNNKLILWQKVIRLW